MAANANAANWNVFANVAAPNPLHDALGRMGFAQATINFMTIDQGMDSLAEFQILTDDEVESLCKVLRRPGGTTGNPPYPSSRLCGVNPRRDEPQADVLCVEVWGEDQPHCVGDGHHPRRSACDENSPRMGGKPQRCGPARFF